MCSFRFLCMSVSAVMRSNSPNRLIPLKLSPDYFSTDRASSRSVAVEETIVNKHKLLRSLLLLSLKFRHISFKIYWVVVNLCPKLKSITRSSVIFHNGEALPIATYHSLLLEAQITAIGWASGHWRNWSSLNGTSNNITNTEAIMRARWDGRGDESASFHLLLGLHTWATYSFLFGSLGMRSSPWQERVSVTYNQPNLDRFP